MRKIDNKSFSGYVKSMSDQKRTFIVGKKRGNKGIIFNNKYLVMNRNKNIVKNKKVKSSEINSLIGQVAKSVNRFLVSVKLDPEIIKQEHPSTSTNRRKYRLMKDGAKFYYVDIAHCYWRISFLKRYISEKLYNNVLLKDELKLFRNIALACIVSPAGRTYYIRGVKSYVIEEDRSLHRIIYNNIRFTCYNLLGEIAKSAGDSFIAYRTDGIMVEKKGLAKVKKLMKENNFMFTVKECEKMDELYYLYEGDKKKM